MSCFTCNDCLPLPDLSKCAEGINVSDSWSNETGAAASYKLVWSFNGRDYSHEFEIANGAPVVLPHVLQHQYIIEFYVLNPADEKLTVESEGTVYDCFQIKVTSAINV